MLILQINTVRASIRYRRLEWAAALVTTLMGAILLQPYPTFTNPYWSTMASWASEDTWGFGCLALGAVRLSVLYYNGRWHRCSHARMLLAGLNCFIWAALVYGLGTSGQWPVGLAPHLVFFLSDLLTVYDAAAESRLADEARRAIDPP